MNINNFIDLIKKIGEILSSQYSEETKQTFFNELNKLLDNKYIQQAVLEKNFDEQIEFAFKIIEVAINKTLQKLELEDAQERLKQRITILESPEICQFCNAFTFHKFDNIAICRACLKKYYGI